ncbi:MAG TPA: uroporphyrinogen-III synthase [Acidimicrobiia bacterium]|nr:uroporphyrinogen-III synthase [Acidimicrobiia bacterium]
MSRVGLTTAGDRISRLAGIARRHGLEPVALPCIAIVAAGEDELDSARSRAGRADLILVTSSRAVSTLWPEGGMPRVPSVAVGPVSAEAVERAGGRVVATGSGGVGSLIEETSGLLADRSVFFPHATGADPSTVGTLERLGAKVRAFPVYEARPIPPGRDQVDAAIFGSPSAVSGWCRSRALDELVLAAIGETTSEELIGRGYRPEVITSRPHYDTLIPLLAEYLHERSFA